MKKNFLYILILLLSFTFYTKSVFAAPPTGGYEPGATLDPDCAPGDADCTVQASPWVKDGTNVYYDGGNVGIGTDNPQYFVDINSPGWGTLFRIDANTGQVVTGGINGTYIDVNGDGGVVSISSPYYMSLGDIEGYYNGSQLVIDSYNNTSSFLNTNLGIGTSTPQMRLTVKDGNGYFYNEGTDGIYIGNQIYTGADGGLYSGNADQKIATFDVVSNLYEYGNGSLNVLYDPNSGTSSVGIGTNAPSYLLDVLGRSNFNGSTSFLANSIAYGVVMSAGYLGNESGLYSGANDSIISTYDYNTNLYQYGNGRLNVFDDQNGIFRVGIGNTSPDNSAVLDISSTSLGFLAPRMTEGQRDSISSPANGLLVYNTDTNRFNYFNGSSWGVVGSAGGGSSPIVLGSSGNTLYTPDIDAGEGDLSQGGNIFLGANAGRGASGAFWSNFLGIEAGRNASGAFSSNFLGFYAGYEATDANNSNFFGSNAGEGAIAAGNSNFFGYYAGNYAENAYFSNFFGESAGNGATNSAYSNFFGQQAGQGASNASWSNFFGQQAGQDAVNAAWSNFLGYQAGQNATDANNSNFFGTSAGKDATNATDSVFLGSSAGGGAVDAASSQFIGNAAGSNATNAANSVFLGSSAGSNATNAANSIFIGNRAGFNDAVDNVNSGTSSILIGYNTSTGGFTDSIALGIGATNTSANQFLIDDSYIYMNLRGVNYELPSSDGLFGYSLTTDGNGVLSWTDVSGGGGSGAVLVSGQSLYSPVLGAGAGSARNIFLGYETGSGASIATDAVMLGYQAGKNSLDGRATVFIGTQAGISTNLKNGVFIGYEAGGLATNAEASIFIGPSSGKDAAGANNSVFVGSNAGNTATNASYSNFVGDGAGSNATNASYSNFFGEGAGSNATNASESTFLGRAAGIGAVNAANSIFIGSAAGFNDLVDNVSGGIGSILIGVSSSTGGFSDSIAIGTAATNTASNQFLIGSGTMPINSTRIIGSAGTECTITTGTGIACSSDERLKDNIEDISNGALEKVRDLRAVTYTWLQDEDSGEQVGFLAQQLEEYFPQIVATNNQGYKSVFYSQMTPILTKAIQELSDVVYGIFENFETKRVQTEELCVGSTCITEEQFLEVFGSTQSNNNSNEVTESENSVDTSNEVNSSEDVTQEVLTEVVQEPEVIETSNDDIEFTSEDSEVVPEVVEDDSNVGA